MSFEGVWQGKVANNVGTASLLKVHGLYNKQKKERHGAAHAEDHVLDNMKKKFGQIGEIRVPRTKRCVVSLMR